MSEPMARRVRGAHLHALHARRSLLAYACVVLAAAGMTGGLTACGQMAATTAGRPASVVVGRPVSAPPDASPAVRAAVTAKGLSDVDLVGQVLVPFAYGKDANHITANQEKENQSLAGVSTPAEMIAKYHLGGMILMAPTNLSTAAQVRQLTTGLQAAAAKLPAGVPLLVGTDQEYGIVTRLASGVVQLPSGLTLGAAADPALTRAAWAAAGADLATIGLNVDFAPDADVLAKPGNTVIASRSFGSSPAAVSAQVTAAVTGIQSAGIAASIKHFPGHGDTDGDSHVTLPVLSQSITRLTANDLAPFRAGIAAGTDMIMAGHLDVQSIDPGLPASFSHKVLTDLLRHKMGFTGVVITDSLGMAPARRWSPAEAAIRALLAGDDMLLMPPDIAAVQKGILAALKSGRLPRAQLIASVTRILTLKNRLATTASTSPLSSLNSAAARATVAKVTAEAVTVLQGPCTGRIVTGPVTVASSAGRGTQRDWLTAALRADGVTVLDSGGAVVYLIGYLDGTGDLPKSSTVTVAMDTPYLLAKANSPVRMATYSSTQASMVALAAVIAGKATARGSSPLPVTGLPRTACAPHG